MMMAQLSAPTRNHGSNPAEIEPLANSTHNDAMFHVTKRAEMRDHLSSDWWYCRVLRR